MTILVYSCDPDNISNRTSRTINNKKLVNDTVALSTYDVDYNQQNHILNQTDQQFVHNNYRHQTLSTNNKRPRSTSLVIDSYRENSKNLNIEQKRNCEKTYVNNTMTKSPLGSQIDISNNLDTVNKKTSNQYLSDQQTALRKSNSKNTSPSDNNGTHGSSGGSSGGGGVGGFFRNHLRNTSPSKHSTNSDSGKRSPKKSNPTSQKSSPKGNRKPSVATTATDSPKTPTTQENISHRHGSFSSPFRMPKFSSSKSDHQSSSPDHHHKSSAETSSGKSDSNLISTATSALRRLHFKSGRHGSNKRNVVTTTNGQQNVVPKLIVMGSSSTSETTINTSTDSANTIVTNMTTTEEYLTEDSLEKQDSLDKYLPMHTDKLIDIEEPLTESPNQITPDDQSSSRPLNDITALDDDAFVTTSERTYLFQSADDQPSANVPKTAFYEQKFTFETPPSPAGARTPSIIIPSPPKSPKYTSKTNETKFTFDTVTLHSELSNRRSRQSDSPDPSSRPTTPHLKRRQSENLSLTNTDNHYQHKSKKSSSISHHHHRSHSRRRRQSSPRDELSRHTDSLKTKSYDSHSSSRKSSRANLPQLEPPQSAGPIITASPQILPDLRVDFFSNSIDATQQDIVTLDTIQNANEKNNNTVSVISNSVCLNQCLREVGARLECALTPCSGGALGHNINVTTNPLDSSTVHSLNRNMPQATIVVQQPSLSLDCSSTSGGTTNVSTVLLKNGVEFVSNVSVISPPSSSASVSTCGGKTTTCTSSTIAQQQQQSGGNVQSSSSAATAANVGKSTNKRQMREENMKQLLDVANTLTLEELHDFEMRYGSPHHSRSQSVKTPGRSSGGRPNYLCLPQQRSRVASMPNTGVEEEYYRLRHFSITGKGVVNRGDSLKSRRSRSNNSVASSTSSTEHLTTQPGPASYPGSARTSVSSRESSNASQTGGLLVTSGPSTSGGSIQAYRVAMLGAAGVGKSSLVSQFMTSEYLHAYDTSIDDDSYEKSVSVLLAGEESELTFIDLPYAEVSPENVLGTYVEGEEPHAYCVVYSCADRGSLEIAERSLATLWTSGLVASKAVILVANKADLVRSRVVSTDEGKAMATQYDCKFIETSVGINHNVDELLVGILTQIRLKLENPEKTRDLFRKRSSKKNRSKSPNRVGTTITSALTSCGGGSDQNGDGDETKTGSYCWGTSSTTDNIQNSPKKYRGARTSASLKVKGLLGKVWARDSKSKSCENLHVL